MPLLEVILICTLNYSLHSFPGVLNTLPQDSGPSLSFEDARKVCLERAVRPDDFSRIELVYGRAGQLLFLMM